MAEGNKNKLLYIVVVDDDEKNDGKNTKIEKGRSGNESFRYARSVLQSALQLMGCKPRHAFKITKRVFEIMTSQSSTDAGARVGRSSVDASNAGLQDLLYTGDTVAKGGPNPASAPVNDGGNINFSSESYKRHTTVFVNRAKFLDIVCDALAQYKYVGPYQREDLILACKIREKKESMTVLLCGTSGCGKSTLSSLLGSRLGITTVISTDSIRHMMRGFVDEKESPLLWASTYHAGEYLDPVAVAEAKARREARKTAGKSHALSKDKLSDSALNEKTDGQKTEVPSTVTEVISAKQMAIEGFRAQSEMVIESLHRLITSWEERKESVIVEGVHLSLNFVMGLMKKHPSIIPFMIYITDEDKHLERFAVRAKYMTLDPAKNKYVKYIKNIRRIQEYLCNRADKHLVPKINNTNVDKSVATIHATLFSCIRRRETGEQLYDPNTNTVSAIYEEYRNQCVADSLSSKGMFQLIQRKGSSRNLMALIYDDGSVAKVWPVSSIDKNGKPIDNGIVTPMYGPLQIDKAEPVNLQFGHFGLSAWPSDTCGTSHASSFDDTRTDGHGTDTGSRCYSSCCSSPRMSDGPAKWPKEEHSVSGSEEEVDDPHEMDSDEDLSDGHKHTHEEIEGSVDEGSANSDEEYDDLETRDDQEKGYWSDKDEEFKERLLPGSVHLAAFLKNNRREDRYPPTLDMFLRSQSGPLCEQNGQRSALLAERHEKKLLCPNNARLRKRSLSTPSSGKHGVITDLISHSTPER